METADAYHKRLNLIPPKSHNLIYLIERLSLNGRGIKKRKGTVAVDKERVHEIIDYFKQHLIKNEILSC